MLNENWISLLSFDTNTPSMYDCMFVISFAMFRKMEWVDGNTLRVSYIRTIKVASLPLLSKTHIRCTPLKWLVRPCWAKHTSDVPPLKWLVCPCWAKHTSDVPLFKWLVCPCWAEHTSDVPQDSTLFTLNVTVATPLWCYYVMTLPGVNYCY